MGATNRFHRSFRESDVTHFAFGHQPSNGANGLFDWGVGVDSVLVVQIDVVGPESPQGPFDG